MINFYDQLDNNITPNFIWRECLYLPSWGIYVIPPPHIQRNIIDTCRKAEDIRALCGNRSMRVTSMYRPQSYNNHIGGAQSSMHMMGKAMDYTVSGVDLGTIRDFLSRRVDELEIRIELQPEGADWIHFDIGDGPRLFTP
jgi:hypothetical protein